MAELTRKVRAACAGREIHLLLENDHNASHLLDRDDALRPRHATAQWNDDAHHALHVLATGEVDGYYADYADRPLAHLGRALAEGFVHQHDWSAFRNAIRGEPSAHLPPLAFVNFVQNHDQIGNRAFGERITAIATEERVRVVVASFLLAPSPPMLFMGEDFAASTPFLFFCDFEPDLAQAVTRGRRKEFARFARFADPAARERIPDPNAAATFEASRLRWDEIDRSPHRDWLAFHRRCLDVRRRELVPHLATTRGNSGRYTVGDEVLRVTWQLGEGVRWQLLVNAGAHDADVETLNGEVVFDLHGEAGHRRNVLPAHSVRVVRALRTR
jgi:maltooligosyltrehalose trehalohydrolase